MSSTSLLCCGSRSLVQTCQNVMAHVSRFITRNSQLSQHLHRPQLAWTTRSLTAGNGTHRSFTIAFVGSFYETRQTERTHIGWCHPRTSIWSRASGGRSVTSSLWSENWHATQRRGFSQASKRHDNAKDERKKDPLKSVVNSSFLKCF